MIDRGKACLLCESKYHQSWQCPTKRKPMNRGTSTLKTTKRMAPVGKQGKKTASAVAAWKRQQKPNSRGLYQCYICGHYVPYLMCEHVYSKTRHPELREDFNNFEPVCAPHNKLKGSLDITDFLAKYPEFKATVKPKYL